jgi:hypothetical protein
VFRKCFQMLWRVTSMLSKDSMSSVLRDLLFVQALSLLHLPILSADRNPVTNLCNGCHGSGNVIEGREFTGGMLKLSLESPRGWFPCYLLPILPPFAPSLASPRSLPSFCSILCYFLFFMFSPALVCPSPELLRLLYDPQSSPSPR